MAPLVAGRMFCAGGEVAPLYAEGRDLSVSRGWFSDECGEEREGTRDKREEKGRKRKRGERREEDRGERKRVAGGGVAPLVAEGRSPGGEAADGLVMSAGRKERGREKER